MIARLLADENLNRTLVNAIRQCIPQHDFVLAQEVNLIEVEDPIVLAWAAREQRVVVAHDVNTMPDFAYDRIRSGLLMPGLIVVRANTPLGRMIDDLHLFLECEFPDALENTVRFIPIH